MITAAATNLELPQKAMVLAAGLLALTGLVFTGMIVAIALHAAHVTFEDVYHMGTFNSRQNL